jgi:hypothetical protein
MTVIWDDYQPYDPGVTGAWQDLPRRDAHAAFDRLIAAKGERIDVLRALLARNGVDLSEGDAGLQDLNDWFRTEVQPDPTSPGRMAPDWYPVVNDLALFLGDVIIARRPNLSWQFFIAGKKDIAYQRPVISGFTGVANPKYNIDPGRLLATYGHRIVAGQPVEDDAFWQWVRAAESKA